MRTEGTPRAGRLAEFSRAAIIRVNGDVVRALMLSKCHSPATLARACGLSTTTVRQVVRGQRTHLVPMSAARLAEALDVHPDVIGLRDGSLSAAQ